MWLKECFSMTTSTFFGAEECDLGVAGLMAGPLAVLVLHHHHIEEQSNRPGAVENFLVAAVPHDR